MKDKIKTNFIKAIHNKGLIVATFYFLYCIAVYFIGYFVFGTIGEKLLDKILERLCNED